MPKQHTRDSVIEELRKFRAQHKRNPRNRDVDGSIRAAAAKIFGSFESALSAALNTPDPKDEVLKDVRALFEKIGTIPDSDAMRDYKTSLPVNVGRFYNHICNALDKAIGTSFCTEILRIMYALSPVGASEVTAVEVEEELKKKNIVMARHSISVHLHELTQQQLVAFGKYDKVSWWKLTPLGRTRAAAMISSPSKGEAGRGS